MNKQSENKPVWREAAINKKSKEQQKKVTSDRINQTTKKMETR